MWKIEYRWLPAVPFPFVLVLGFADGEDTVDEVEGGEEGLDIHINGATVTLFFPASEPATKCIDRSDGSMEWWGRDSL